VILGLFGCGDDDMADAEVADAASQTDAASQHVDAAVPAELLESFRRALDAYDDQGRATCACLVESGAYETADDCLKYVLSKPDWAECAAATLAEDEYENAREVSGCFARQAELRAECVAASKCEPEAMSDCLQLAVDCTLPSNEQLNRVLLACPDTGLLSRLDS
jgi:hypothetical protein